MCKLKRGLFFVWIISGEEREKEGTGATDRSDLMPKHHHLHVDPLHWEGKSTPTWRLLYFFDPDTWMAWMISEPMYTFFPDIDLHQWRTCPSNIDLHSFTVWECVYSIAILLYTKVLLLRLSETLSSECLVCVKDIYAGNRDSNGDKG